MFRRKKNTLKHSRRENNLTETDKIMYHTMKPMGKLRDVLPSNIELEVLAFRNTV